MAQISTTKTKMGMAGLMFEPHPPNCETFMMFKCCLNDFLIISTVFKDQFGSVPSIPVTVLGLLHVTQGW